jgi:eukaryotic-like serine/threonine-protein kinase
MADETPPKKTVHTEATINVNSVSGDAKVIGTNINNLTAEHLHLHEVARPALTAQERRNRQVILNKVEQFWVRGVLDQSLYKMARIELGLESDLGAVVNPWESIVQRPEQPDRVPPSGKPIVEVFDELQGSMLILGAPGAGKTSLLLELARDLIARARADEGHPIPVVFNLSSWAVQRKPLKEWLVEELNLRYDVPGKVGQGWVDADMLLPMLDGLDEVAVEHQDACIEAVNTYRQQETMVPMAVCSRVSDYEKLTGKVRLQGAVVVQPLDKQQVDAYLKQMGKPMAGVRTLLRDEPSLFEMLDTPLMLSVVILAYIGRNPMRLRTSSRSVKRRKLLFDDYIEAMFERRISTNFIPKDKVLKQISWLASNMREEDILLGK